MVPVSSRADVDELTLCRVKQPDEVQALPSAPSESIPAATAQLEGLWPVEQHDLTEAFEPLPDSPTGGLTAQGRSHDQQQRDTVEAQREPGGVAKKLSPLQQVQAHARYFGTQLPCLVSGSACHSIASCLPQCIGMAGYTAATSTATRYCMSGNSDIHLRR
jgi:hypothetical protein